MTREEAMHIVDIAFDIPQAVRRAGEDRTYHKKEIREAKDMAIKALSRSEKPNRWIPVSERLPENTDPVSITWVNHDPESYYANIKDKSFTATGHYCNGRWWWYSVTCQDYLDEYGRCDVDAMDDAIEVIAWMPLPEPYKASPTGAESEDDE